ncbi:hypothetical protein [Shewanella livingstonensis]|uniref:DUF1593 domain-containing protein n=1 Tax=Shewanella livingstonensis TaxID=150120 RepID=A0A3G8LT95_9GAMM|nr:hypothetical protein [Shewanella livingstonensis]AZG72791.1 hypothetical protein EGC82_08430 [Shewanella livingstonensis]
MIKSFVGILVVLITLVSFNSQSAEPKFDIEKDLLLLNFDLKTDVDDVHTVAALDLILKSKAFKKLNYYAISGTYGIQSGAYVPANELFNMVFDQHWTDAHNYRQTSIDKTTKKINQTLSLGGNIWIAEAGQSDFTQELLEALSKNNISFTKDQIIVVQHADWNEQETSVDALNYVKQETTYIRITDGNKTDNGTPGFNDQAYSTKNLENKHLISSKVWTEANKICTKYNGVNGRYNNKAISGGGADFSDLVEITYILNIQNTPTVADFFTIFNKDITEN